MNGKQDSLLIIIETRICFFIVVLLHLNNNQTRLMARRGAAD